MHPERDKEGLNPKKNRLVWSGSSNTVYLPASVFEEGFYIVDGALVSIRINNPSKGIAGVYGGKTWCNVVLIEVYWDGPNNRWYVIRPVLGHYAGVKYEPIMAIYKVD